ncbi:MAG: hypothetical protein ABIN89_07705 [Chitinophagaceae bacterium]
MKRSNYILAGGFLLIITAFVVLYNLNSTIIPVVDSRQKHDSAFTHYREGRTVNVSLGLQPESEIKLTIRERMDQVRDWLLYSILSDAGLSTEQIGQLTFDLPLTRAGYNENITNCDYTKTRSRNIGNGVVVALFPSASSMEEAEYISHIADEQQKNTGEIPLSVLPFRYKIDTVNNRGILTRLSAITGTDIYSEKYGYYSLKVTGIKDLKTFLAHTRDLVSIKNSVDGLILGGRQLRGGVTRNVTMEDIAAIYQSEEQIKEKNNAFNNKWTSQRYTTESEKFRLEEAMKEEQKRLHLVSGSGFSLDPSYRYGDLAALINKYKQYLRLYDTNNDFEGIYYSAFFKGNEQPFLNFLYKLKQNPDAKAREISDFLFYEARKCQFQKARYDGELQGTEVGMHLFYTDLLAKLWSMNYADSSPLDSIYGFVTDVSSAISMSRIYEKERDSFPSCRLWFGPNNGGYQTVGFNDRLLFARNATKIYSASSDPLQPGTEVPVSALFAGPMNWMNGHYEEIAAYEQEYQVLNEIMKWSLVIGWLNANENSGKMDFLNDVPVKRDLNFTEWVHQHPALKYNDWHRISFFGKGYNGSETEALPLLQSQYTAKGQARYIEGGVSLAEKATLKSTSALSEDVSVLLRRSNLDYSQAGSELKFLKGATYDFKTVGNEYNIITKVAGDTKLRARFEELGSNNFERTIAAEGNQLKFRFSQKDVPIGDLQVQKVSNGFDIGFRSRDIDRVQSFARELSDVQDPQLFIAGSAKTEALVTLEKNKRYLVKVKGSDNWTKIELQGKPDVFLPAQWDSRVAGITNESKICLIKFMNETEAKALAGNRSIIYKSSNTSSSIASSYQKGNYAGVIEEFGKSADLAKFKTAYRKKYFDELHDLDRISDKAEYDLALKDLAEARSNTPELKLRLALRELEKGRIESAEDLLNNAFGGGVHADADFYNDLHKIQLINQAEFSSQDMQTLNSYLRLKGHDDIRMANIDFDAMPSGKNAPLGDAVQQINHGKARVFVENNPGLNNLDWNIAFQSTIDVNKLPPGIRIIEMNETSLANYRYELKIVPAEGKDGKYKFKLSARPNSISAGSSNKDTTNTRIYYMYIDNKATTKI